MKKIIYSSLLVLAITLLPSACDNDSDMNSPHGSTTPPEQVVLNGVKNLPGKSIIYFTQPSDKNFLYMKAVYMTEIGERSTNASYFADSVVVEGFETCILIKNTRHNFIVNRLADLSKIPDMQ